MDEYSKWHGSWCLIVSGIILKKPVVVAKLAQSAVASASQRSEAYSADDVFSTLQDAAHRAVEQAGIIRLSMADQACFAQALLNPPEPTPALKRAFARRKKLLHKP